MPLPAALLARLKRRGIVDEAAGEEEVIAESYDDESGTGKCPRSKVSINASGAPGCPNKWNPFHCCVDFCYDKWREGTPEHRLDPDYNRRRLRMLRKYPLPSSWREVYDPGLVRHYYWDTETDEVSWLSPIHPNAVIGEAAPRLARNVFEKVEYQKELAIARAAQYEKNKLQQQHHQQARRRNRRKSPNLDNNPSSGSDSSEDEDKNEEETLELSTFDKLKRARRRGLDPMDPSAYGDCSRGKWSAGLDLRGEAKTGVDTTAGGPLFQSRPYPAPGAILRQNADLCS